MSMAKTVFAELDASTDIELRVKGLCPSACDLRGRIVIRVRSGKTAPLTLGEIRACNQENLRDKGNHEQTISNISHLRLYSCSESVVVGWVLTRHHGIDGDREFKGCLPGVSRTFR